MVLYIKLFVFHRLYNHIQLSSNLMSGCDYSLFKVTVGFYGLNFVFHHPAT